MKYRGQLYSIVYGQATPPTIGQATKASKVAEVEKVVEETTVLGELGETAEVISGAGETLTGIEETAEVINEAGEVITEIEGTETILESASEAEKISKAASELEKVGEAEGLADASESVVTVEKVTDVASETGKVPNAYQTSYGKSSGNLTEGSTNSVQKTIKDVEAPILPEGSQWERNVLNSFAGGKSNPIKYDGVRYDY